MRLFIFRAKFGRLRGWKLKSERKKTTTLPVVGSIAEDLKRKFGERIAPDVISEIAEYIDAKFVKKIFIYDIAYGDICVMFKCNLSPEEMQERKEEVSVHLPRTDASEDYMYHVVLQGTRDFEKEYLPQKAKMSNAWIYYAFA